MGTQIKEIMVQEILLIRHTSLEVPRGVCYGFTDFDVSQNFEKEATWLRDQISDFQPDFVYSSPLKRCTKLAEFVFDQPLILDSDFKELNCGEWEGKLWRDINVPENNHWMYKFPSEQTPDGESFYDLKKRVTKKFNQILENDFNKLALVCHGGVIRSVLSDLLDIPLSKTKQVHIHYVGHIRLQKLEGIWKLVELNHGKRN